MAVDQFASSIISLLHFDGASGSTTLTDSSNTTQNALAVGTAALSTTQSKIGGASLKTGSANGNYAKLPLTKALDLGAGDFTLEAWVWPVSQGTSYGAIFGRWDDANSAVQDFLVARASNGAVQVSVNGAQLIAGNASDLPTGAWAHVAVTRAGTSVKVWINGTQVSSATLSGAINCAMSQGIVLGQSHFSGGSTFLEAYYDEFCLTAACRYTATFTPPTTPYGTPDNTNYVLMLHGEGSTGGYPTDSSVFAAQGSVLVGTGVTTSTAQKKFGSSSIAFDGASSIQYPNGAQFDLSSNAPDWTVEFFVYLNAYPASGNTQVLNKDAVFGTTNPSYALSIGTAGKVNLLFGNGTSGSGVQVMLGVTQVIPLNTWTHVAAVRKGTTAYVFVGGVLDQSATITSTMVNGTGTLRLGNVSGGAAGEFLNGYLDEVRITKGIGRYTVTFNPPTQQFLDDDGSFTGPCTMLIHGDGANNAVVFRDTGATPHAVLPTAGVKLSTASVKIGTAAIRFSGSQNTTTNQDRLDVSVSDGTLTFGTGDFTIEMWVNMVALPGAGFLGFLMDWRPTTTNGAYPALYVDQNGKVVYYVTGAIRITASVALSAGTYGHVALVRKANVTTLYINGAVAGTYADSNNYLAPGGSRVCIGASGYDSSSSLNAYLDEIEITTGGARYVAPFTPLVVAFADGLSSTRKTFGQPAPYAYSRLLSTPLTGPFNQTAKRTAPGQTDATWGGKGRVAGQTTVNNTPTPQKVRLLEEGGALVQSAWSDASGNYVFDNVNESYKYIVLGRDYSKTYNAVVQDNITPLIMPLYSSYPAEANVKFRRKLTMPQTVGLGANHAVLLRVGESPGSFNLVNSGNPLLVADVVLPLKTLPTAKGDYAADINFTDLSGNNLPYWLERITGTTPNRIFHYWVNLGSQNLDSAAAQCYVVYNGVTPVASTGAATFPLLFDDFLTTFDATKWAGYPNNSIGSVTAGGMQVAATYGREIKSLATFGQGYEVFGAPGPSGTYGNAYSNTPGEVAWNFGFVGGTLGTPTKLANFYNLGSDTGGSFFGVPGEADNAAAAKWTTTRQSNATLRASVARGSDGSVVANYNDTVIRTVASGVPSDAVPVGLMRSAATSATSMDYVAVRKYVVGAPALVIGYEEIAP